MMNKDEYIGLLIFRTVATHLRGIDILLSLYNKFPAKSVAERIMKIGQY